MSLKERRYYVGDKSNKEWVLVNRGDILTGKYITFDELLKKHSDGEYTIVGEVLQKYDVSNEQTKSIAVGDRIFLVNPVGMYSTKSYENIGYIPCGENEYIGFYKKKKSKLLPLILIPILILSLILGVWYLKDVGNNDKNKLEIDSSITDYEGELKRPADMDTTQILIPGFSKLRLKEGSNIVNTTLFNPADNPCFFQFNVVDKTTGDILYESKLVPPGKGINSFKINKTFKAGEYPAVIQFKSHDLEDPTINYNGSEMEVVIEVSK